MVKSVFSFSLRGIVGGVRALDLFCCGGGASAGLARAGFDVTGVDIAPQRHYPYTFLQADVALLDNEFLAGFDLIWASPPCQRWTNGAGRWRTRSDHPDLIGPTRCRLREAGRPFVLENVANSPLRRDLLLCGAMFGFRLIRHRIFEIHGFSVPQPAHRPHHTESVTVTGHTGGSSTRDGTAGFGSIADWREAMGIDWLPASKLREAVPPAYAEHIGRAFLRPSGVGSPGSDRSGCGRTAARRTAPSR